VVIYFATYKLRAGDGINYLFARSLGAKRYAHQPCLMCTNLDKYQVFKLSSSVVLQRWREAIESKYDVHPMQHFIFTGQSIHCYRK